MPHSFARNSFFGAVAALSTALTNFGFSVIAARLLTVDDFGTVVFALWLIALSAAVADLGCGAALSRYLPELQASGRDEAAGNAARLLFRVFAAGVLAIGLGLFLYVRLSGGGGSSSGLPPWFWPATGLAFVLQATGQFSYGYLRGMQRFDRIAKLNTLGLVAQLGFTTAGCLAFGAVGAIVGFGAAYALPALLALSQARRGVSIDAALRRRITLYALFAWGAGLATALLYARMEIFFLNRSWGMEAVGLFAVGITIANIAAQGPMMLTTGLLPYFAEAHGREDRASIQRMYATSVRIMAFMVFPSAFGVAAILPVLLPLIYGRSFEAAVPAAMILAVGSAGGVAYVGSQLMLGLNRSDLNFVITVSSAAALILGCAVLVPVYGVIGAALLRSGIMVCVLVVNLSVIQRRLAYVAPTSHLVRLFLAALLSAASAFATVRWFGTVTSLAAAIPLAVIVYGLAVRYLGGIPAEDIGRINQMLVRLPRRAAGPTGRVVGFLSRQPMAPNAMGWSPGAPP